MPLPSPHGKQSKNSFISDCIKSLSDKGEFETPEQRAAVCYRQWSDAKKRASASIEVNKDEILYFSNESRDEWEEIFAAKVDYLNKELYQKVRQDANKKFDKDSYVKNLWVLKEYKRRGGKVKQTGKKPSSESIKKQIKGGCGCISVDLSDDFHLTNQREIDTIQAELKNMEHLIENDEEIQDLACDLEYLLASNFDELLSFYDTNTFEVEAADNKDKIAEIYKKYHATVNMGYNALKKWSENPCSKVASLSRGPINRNLRLLSKSKDEWTMADARSANRTISFVSRMKGAEQGQPTKTSDGKSCPSKRDISLKNWAYNP